MNQETTPNNPNENTREPNPPASNYGPSPLTDPLRDYLTRSEYYRTHPYLFRSPFTHEDLMANPNLELADTSRAAYPADNQIAERKLHAEGRASVPDFIGDVYIFMKLLGQERQLNPTCSFPTEDVRELRRSLINSEHLEFNDADFKDDMPEIADALADLIYVIVGTAIAYGIPLAQVWNAVQQANMNKLWTAEEIKTIPQNHLRVGWKVRGTTLPENELRRFAVIDEVGKVRKPPSWKAPDIKSIIEEAQRVPEQEARRAKWNETLSKEAEPGNS